MKMKRSLVKLLLLPLFPVLVLVVFLLTFSVNVSAAGEEISNYPIPFKFSERHDYNTWDSDNDLYDSIMTSIYNAGLPVNDSDYVLILTDFQPYASEGSYLIYRSYYLLIPIDIYTSYYNTFNGNSFSYDILNQTCYSFGVHFDILNNGFTPIVFNVNNNPTFNHSMFGHSSISVYNNMYKFTAYVPYYFSKDFYDDQDHLILDYSEVPIVNPIGHATEPDPFEDPEFTTGHAQPSQVPTLTINNYTWTTVPTPDFSTLENTAKSIYDVLKWLADNLLGEFSNLINNLENIGEYIGATIQYYGGLIIKAIQNGISIFYNNMVSLFEPIANTLNTIGVIASTIAALGTEDGVFSIPVLVNALFVPSASDVVSLLVANDDFGFINFGSTCAGSLVYFKNTLNNISPKYKIHVPSLVYHNVQIGDYDIDFSWFSSYKTYTDPIISAFLIFGYVWWIVVTFKDHLRGHFTSEIHDDGSSERGFKF